MSVGSGSERVVVLVHGVPETSAVWDPLLAEMGDVDVRTPRLPGFGTQRPEDFGATKDEYARWLVGELEAMGDRVIDLVGHDWGGGFVARLVSTRPELVRSWVSDAVGLASPNFEWHDFAKLWQTPGEGEAFFAQQLATPPADSAAIFETFGVPGPEALAMAEWVDETMAGCILDLYRSAVFVNDEWGPDLRDVPAPGLVLAPELDPFIAHDMTAAGAAQAGAELVDLEGLGHWWMLQDPARAAAVLERFWSSFD